VSDLLAALVVVFIAELGDKTQLVALGFGARHRLSHVVIGMALAYIAAGAVSVVAGVVVGAALPTRAVSLLGGVLFLGFAFWTLRGGDGDHPVPDDAASQSEEPLIERSSVAVVASVAVAMFVAEFGDKTMLATATLASRGNAVAVFVGATIGIFLAGVLGAVVGRAVGQRLPERIIRIGASAVFAVFGVVLIATAL